MQIHAPRVSKALEPVPFRDDTIYAVEYDGEPFTPVKPIVENMGLAWQTQHRKLMSNKDRWGVTIMVIPSQTFGKMTSLSNGGAQETLCIPVRKLPGFLATINPNKVKPELRPKIIAYQNECDDVLWRYWSGKHPMVPVAVAPDPIRLETKLLRTLRNEISRIVPTELDKYARAAAKEEQRQNTVKEKIRKLLNEATPRYHHDRANQRLDELEAKLNAVLDLLRK